MYTGYINVTEVIVCQLLPAATMFQVPDIIDACCSFLERQLDPTNAIGIGDFAEQHGCVALKQKANQFIERHFTQVILFAVTLNYEYKSNEVFFFSYRFVTKKNFYNYPHYN